MTSCHGQTEALTRVQMTGKTPIMHAVKKYFNVAVDRDFPGEEQGRAQTWPKTFQSEEQLLDWLCSRIDQEGQTRLLNSRRFLVF